MMKYLQNVFMGVSLDTYDEKTPIHPRNKQLTCKRLAVSGLNIAYGMNEFPTNGPFPTTVDFERLSSGTQISITYDQSFTWNVTETEGFYTCNELDTEKCSLADGLWKKVESILVFETFTLIFSFTDS